MKEKDLKDLLLALAVAANNCIMKGAYSGDAISEAHKVMVECRFIVDQIGKENE